MEWEPASGEPARVICRKAQLFSKSLLELLHRKNLLDTELGLKRTWPFALHMSAYDPKRTMAAPLQLLSDLL
jgi:hypothetical protein